MNNFKKKKKKLHQNNKQSISSISLALYRLVVVNYL